MQDDFDNNTSKHVIEKTVAYNMMDDIQVDSDKIINM